jgi:peptide/nickel transport system substrate-binding protein
MINELSKFQPGKLSSGIISLLYSRFRTGRRLRKNNIGAKMKKFLVPLLILITLALLLSACGNSTSTTTPPASSTSTVSTSTVSTTATSATPKRGGVFKFADPRAPSTTIGWFAEPGAQGGMWSFPTFESFLEGDMSNNFYPCLATDWQIAPDLKSITLTLRKGVKFQDGSDFNAEVAKWNMDMYIAAKLAPYRRMSSVDVIDDYTIKINLSAYENTILNTLTSAYMVSKDAYDKLGVEGLRWNPIGTGPFKFVSFQRDAVIKFTRFDDYWRKDAQGNQMPYLDGVEMYFVTDPVTMAAAFEAGEFDAFGADAISTIYDQQQKGNPVLKMYSGAYTLTPDSKNADSPWNNLKVRQALDYAVDRDALVKARGFGFWTSIYQFANPGTPAYITDLANRTYDPDKAKQLLTEAGYPDGFQTSLYVDSASSDRDAVTAIQSYMEKVGIKTDLQILDFASYGNYRTKGWGNAVLGGMTGFFGNMNQAIGLYWSQDAMLYPSVDKTDELQNLYTASLTSKDYDAALIQKVIRYMYDNVLCVPLWAGARADAVKPYVHDTGFYSGQAWPTWKPYATWLDK